LRATDKSTTLSLQISNRLFITVLAAWLMVAALAAIVLVNFYRTDQAYSRALREIESIQASALNLNTDLMDEMLNTRAFLISGEQSAVTRRRLAHQEAIRKFNTLDRMLASENLLDAVSLSTLTTLHNEYDSVADQLIKLRTGERTEEALQLFDARSDPLVMSMQDASRSLQEEVRQGMLETSADYSQRTARAIWLVAALFLGSFALSGMVLIRWVSPPLRALDLFESALINAGETQVFQPIGAGPGSSGAPATLVKAYNRLVQRLIESNSSILTYVRYLHHEINTLLAAVLGYGQMLADPNLRPEDACMEDYGQIIVEQTQRTVGLVEDFTLAARIEGNQYAPTLLPVRLVPLITALVDELREGRTGCMEKREIELSGCQRQAGAMIVLADSLNLENALRRIIENALKFSSADQPVHVAVEVARAPRRVLIHVRDHGAGIADEDLPALFRPFSRIKNEITRHIPGNGLGLYLAASILRAHYGSISVQSQVGAGSVFTVNLPLEEG
jgi:signal transduction histidine kinase